MQMFNANENTHRQRRKTPMAISLEPTVDGLAAIFTTLVKLPYNNSNQLRMAAASSLISIDQNSLIWQNKLNNVND